MGIINEIMNYFWNTAEDRTSTSIKVPNGWGRQNYQGKPNSATLNEQVDMNNIKSKKGWIQAYSAEKFEGIQSFHPSSTYYPYHNLTYKKQGK